MNPAKENVFGRRRSAAVALVQARLTTRRLIRFNQG